MTACDYVELGVLVDRKTRLGLEFRLEQQCIFAQFAHEDLLKELDKADQRRSPDRIWYCVHSFLTAAANISKILAPTKRTTQRGDEMRILFDIHQSSPLLNRDLRNMLEHYDEYFEKWAHEQHDTIGFASFCILYGGKVPIDTEWWLTTLHVPTLTVSFLGHVFEIGPVAEAIERLLPKVTSDIRNIVTKWKPDGSWTINSSEFLRSRAELKRAQSKEQCRGPRD